MRVAVFADVHGNSFALEAVLADVKRLGGVDAYWFVGDAADMGADPAGCVQLISTLPCLVAVRGNADRETVSGSTEAEEAYAPLAATDPGAAREWLAIVHASTWARDVVTATGGYDWLAGLPLEERTTLPDGTRVLLVHAAPGTDRGEGIREQHTDDELRPVVAQANADLMVIGHTHRPLDRSIGAVRVWNPGSVSNPVTRDTRAMWTLLESDNTGYHLSRRYVTYDMVGMLRQLAAVHHPSEWSIRAFWDGCEQ